MRGMLAPLSPNEEATLRRVALGSSSVDTLPVRHLRRLMQLNLIDSQGSGFKLTPLGRERYERLERPVKWVANGTPEDIERILARVMLSNLKDR